MSADWLLNDVVVSSDGTEKRMLLDEVNARFEAGKITLLIGSNAAGKSTLLEAMAGVRPLQSGTIELGGQSLWLARRRRPKLNRNVTLQVGIAMQHSESQWFAATVRQELEYSMKPYSILVNEAEQRMNDALLNTGLELEVLDKDPWTLSGGQQRRLSIACLLACEPEWLLLDEPTAGLDADGVRRLCAVLAAHRAEGRGAVVATHDLEALLPLADSVAVVSGGKVRVAPAATAAAAAAEAGATGTPQALRALAILRSQREAEPPDSDSPAAAGGELMWLEPRELAVEYARKLEYKRSNRQKYERADEREVKQKHENINEVKNISEDMQNEQNRQPAVAARHRLLLPDQFDPRAIIMCYLLLTAGVLAQQSLMQLLASALLVTGLLIPFWPLIRPWLRVLRAFFILVILLCFIGGLSFYPLSFQWAKAEPAAIRLGGLIIIMLLGMPMLKLMTPLRLQRSIEQTFGWLNRLNIPIFAASLLVTLIFRFIPLLIGEWGRFAKLAHARGKAVSPPGAIPINMLRSIMIPYLRSILHLAEQMADALEMRGYGQIKRKPTYGFRLKFGVPDAVIMAIASCGSALLWAISRMI